MKNIPKLTIEDLQKRFSWHPPATKQTADNHALVRHECLKVASQFNDVLPPSREKSLAITKIEEAMMWANASIARNQDVIDLKKIMENDV